MQFHIGDVLSITTGKLMSPDRMNGVYKILNFLTQDKLCTHQLGRAADECIPWLLQWYPELSEIDADAINVETVDAILQECIEKFGEYLELQPIPADDHTRKEPIQEAIDIGLQNKLMVVDSDTGRVTVISNVPEDDESKFADN